MIFGSLTVFICMTDLKAVWQQLAGISTGFVWILVVSLMAYFTGALAWKHCFRNTRLPLYRLLYTRTLGELITLFNPSNIIAGEAFKNHTLKTEVTDGSELIDSILISRAIMIVSQLSLLIVCSLVVAGIYLGIYTALGLALALSLVLTACVLFLSIGMPRLRLRPFTLPCFKRSRRIKRLTVSLRQTAHRLIKHFKTHPRAMGKAFAWSCIHWLLGAFEIFLLLIFLGHPAGFLDCITVDMGVVFLKSLGSVVPGQLGIEEFANKIMLELIGLTQAGLWLSVSLLRRAKQLFWIALAGALYMLTQIFFNKNKTRYGHTVCNT